MSNIQQAFDDLAIDAENLTEVKEEKELAMQTVESLQGKNRFSRVFNSRVLMDAKARVLQLAQKFAAFAGLVHVDEENIQYDLTQAENSGINPYEKYVFEG